MRVPRPEAIDATVPARRHDASHARRRVHEASAQRFKLRHAHGADEQRRDLVEERSGAAIGLLRPEVEPEGPEVVVEFGR